MIEFASVASKFAATGIIFTLGWIAHFLSSFQSITDLNTVWKTGGIVGLLLAALLFVWRYWVKKDETQRGEIKDLRDKLLSSAEKDAADMKTERDQALQRIRDLEEKLRSK
jgi:hypothetical protein